MTKGISAMCATHIGVKDLRQFNLVAFDENWRFSFLCVCVWVRVMACCNMFPSAYRLSHAN